MLIFSPLSICRMITMDIEQVICLALALLLAVKYIFFEQEVESTLSLKNPITMSAPSLTQRQPTESCHRQVPPAPRCLEKPPSIAALTLVKKEKGLCELCVNTVAENCSTPVCNSVWFCCR